MLGEIRNAHGERLDYSFHTSASAESGGASVAVFGDEAAAEMVKTVVDWVVEQTGTQA